MIIFEKVHGASGFRSIGGAKSFVETFGILYTEPLRSVPHHQSIEGLDLQTHWLRIVRAFSLSAFDSRHTVVLCLDEQTIINNPSRHARRRKLWASVVAQLAEMDFWSSPVSSQSLSYPYIHILSLRSRLRRVHLIDRYMYFLFFSIIGS